MMLGVANAEARQLEQWGLRFMIPSPPSLASASLSPRFVRVPANPRTEDLRDAVAAGCRRTGQASLAAALLLALCVDDPLDLQALSFFVKDGLGALKDRTTAPPVRVVAAFTVATLRALPPRLRAAVGAEALLPCLKEEVGWEAACCEAAERCRCTPLLAALGVEWGVATWALPSAPRSWDLATGEADFLRALGRAHAGVHEVPAADVGHPTPAEGHGPATQAEVKKELAPPQRAPKASAPAEPPAVTLEEDQKYHILREIREGFCLNQSDAAQLQRNLGGALKRLGDDLYREQHHFVFELLQNGDDNTYPDGAVPCYMLLLCDNMLVALSNEVGFNQENVKSLCSVDSSTKPRQEDGAERIGKKGIGFKSVFKITDTPTIHSTGWHFRFDANLRVQGVDIKELGYIVPEAMPAEDMRFPSWTTEIRLPFKRGLRHEERGLLRQDFEALGGTLLLNLNKLRRLTLWNCPAEQPLPSREGVRPNEEVIASGCRNLCCMDLCPARPHPTAEGTVYWKLVRIFDGQVRDWLCVEGSFPFQAASDSRKVRIKLSFPLPVEVSTDAWLRQELVAQQTFCYLPLRNFGWRLVLHANFDATASRNELHSNSPWNLRIKKLLPKLLATSAHILQENLMLTPMAEGSCALPREALAQPLQVEGLTSEAGERSICHVPYAFFLRFMPLQGGTMGSLALILANAVLVSGQAVNPVAKVISLLSDMQTTIKKEGKAEDARMTKFGNNCELRTAELQYQIKTASEDIDELSARISKAEGKAEALASTLEETSESIASNEADLAAATEVRGKEAADFKAAEKDLLETTATVERAMSMLEKKEAKGESLVQVKGAGSLIQAVQAMMDASVIGHQDAKTLTAFLQDAQAPEPATYVSKTGGVTEMLEDMLDKSKDQLTELRKKDTSKSRKDSKLN
eukprot:s331_g1.t1